jgi:hypothetical protein
LEIFTALSPFYVEQPHDKGSALYKYPTNYCKNNLERSTDPNINVVNFDGKTAHGYFMDNELESINF